MEKIPNDALHGHALRFCVTFGILVGLLLGLSSLEIAQGLIRGPLSRCLAQVSGIVLAPLGLVSIDGATLTFRTFSMAIVDACDGVVPACIFVAAVVAFPSRLGSKIRGVTLGLAALFVLNVARIVSLMLLGAWRPLLFEGVHIYVWQALVVIVAMVLWVVWAEGNVRPSARSSA